MKTDLPRLIRRTDYEPPAYTIRHVELDFDLDRERTLVTATMEIERAGADPEATLVLDGENMEFLGAAQDGRELAPHEYVLNEISLALKPRAARFTLTVRTAIDPAANTALEGLYLSRGMFCTQCEAEGFRRITYFLDRPDVMATYRVTMRANRSECPVLLSNGNRLAARNLGDDRHEAVWEDPFPKPSYLFALVAGNLACVSDRFTTASGREVALHIYVEHGAEDQCSYAMDALKRAMRWDEERFGLEYDLDIFNIVAVSDFNMGAMENKSLNVFNAKYVLADRQTATDADFAHVEGIVAHEYFHNWTGNRITCRDWFQLSLKEGLTVFRDQEFSADQRSRAVKRIQDVRLLRARQFPEDAGPLAHPVRPESYIEINNFYTATVYEKGSEVIRMLHTLLGEQGFMKGMRLYIERHDGQAATCDDFVTAMADATGADLARFARWYAQAGTPVVSLRGAYDSGTRRYTLHLSQTTRPTPGQPEKQPLHIPLRIGLIGSDGGDMPLDGADPALEGEVIHLTKAEQTIVFDNVPEPPILSANRGFSAPVILDQVQTDADLAFLMAHDGDPFARWEAGQQYATRLILRMVDALAAGRGAEIDAAFIEAVRHVLIDGDIDPAFKALAIALPSEDFVGEQLETVKVDEIHEARVRLRRAIGAALAPELDAVYRANAVDEPFSPDAEQAGKRALRNGALGYLCAAGDEGAARLAKAQFDAADNMTDRMAALTLLADMERPQRDAALEDFAAWYAENDQVMDKWFAVQAMSSRPDTLEQVRSLSERTDFSIRNPNRVRALLGAFSVANPVRFNAADGGGYRFLADKVIEIDSVNPQVAARLLGALGHWRRFDDARKAAMKRELERILAVPVLSRDSYEIASRSLGD